VVTHALTAGRSVAAADSGQAFSKYFPRTSKSAAMLEESVARD
jgi:hypothetical protein